MGGAVKRAQRETVPQYIDKKSENLYLFSGWLPQELSAVAPGAVVRLRRQGLSCASVVVGVVPRLCFSLVSRSSLKLLVVVLVGLGELSVAFHLSLRRALGASCTCCCGWFGPRLCASFRYLWSTLVLVLLTVSAYVSTATSFQAQGLF